MARQDEPPRGVATRSAIDPSEALGTLVRHDVGFVVIGGIAALAHGSRRLTEDLDIVIDRRSANCRRLTAALVELEAQYRLSPGKWIKLAPKADPRWIAKDNHLFETRAGGIDVMNKLEGVPSWQEARPRAVEVEAFGYSFFVLDKDTLIRSKLAAGRDKDLADVAELTKSE